MGRSPVFVMVSKRHLLLALIAVGLSLIATDAFAQTVTHSGAKFDGLLDLIQQNAAFWNSRLQSYALRLFWSLAVIQLVMTFFPLVLRQADFGEIAHELVKYILIIGFFYEILAHSTYWANAIIQSFRQAGGIAIGQPSAMQPSGVFAMAVKFADTIGQVHTWNPGVAISVSVASVCVLLAFAFIAAFMAVTLVESYVVINASVLFLGFGGSQWTREYAIAMLRYAVAVGAKLFVLTLLVGLITQSAQDWQAAYNHTDNASMWTMVGLALVCAYLAKTIPELIQGLISGVSVGGGHAIGGIAATALGLGAGVGAAAAAGGLGSAAAAAGSSGGGTGSAGLAGAIDASMSGAGNMARNATGGMGGGADSLSPRMGGGASVSTGSAGAPRSGGGGSTGQSSPRATKTGGASARPTTSTNGAAQQGPSSAGTDHGQRERAQASKGARSKGAAIHEGVALTLRTAGGLSAISVPGMEGAAAVSAGAPPPMPAAGSEDDGNPSSTGPDAENVIQPVAGPSPAPSTSSQPSAAEPPKE